MKFKGVYVDDLEPNYGELLDASSGEDSVEFCFDIQLNEAGKLIKSILNENPDIVALDYRLHDNPRLFPDATYRAGGLAQMLREERIEHPTKDFPIVLISTEDNIRKLFRPDKIAHDLFDGWYLKSALINETRDQEIGPQIIGLIQGYKEIAGVAQEPQKHLSLLKLDSDELGEIKPSSLLISLEEASVTHVIARILLQNVIKRSGLLLRPIDVYARLSLAPENNDRDKAFKFLFDAELGYKGVFSTGWPRLWRHKFENWACENIDDPFSSVPGNRRVDIFNNLAGTTYKAARSKWSDRNDELFSFACASCDAPTELRHSVAAHDPLVPKYAERKRICFDCVQTDLFRARDLRIPVDSEDEDIAEQVRLGNFPRE